MFLLFPFVLLHALMVAVIFYIIGLDDAVLGEQGLNCLHLLLVVVLACIAEGVDKRPIVRE